MNMTNREESSAAEHETYPGPGPLRADEGKRSIRPVEQMVDAAIERIAREKEARAAAREAASGDAAVTPTPVAQALAQTSAQTSLEKSTERQAAHSAERQAALGNETPLRGEAGRGEAGHAITLAAANLT